MLLFFKEPKMMLYFLKDLDKARFKSPVHCCVSSLQKWTSAPNSVKMVSTIGVAYF